MYCEQCSKIVYSLYEVLTIRDGISILINVCSDCLSNNPVSGSPYTIFQYEPFYRHVNFRLNRLKNTYYFYLKNKLKSQFNYREIYISELIKIHRKNSSTNEAI